MIRAMEIYLVGGAVRDALLDLPVKERDWVVVGSSAAELLALGYQQVGRDFPVFLHPKTKEEYALARTERKVAPGYTGFAFDTSQSVTLEQDLARRDLTINAIAENADGGIVDPYGGRADLAAGTLRHISEAFREDPLRVLRTARFAARFAPRAFSVHADTLALMSDIAASGELEALQPERVWTETVKALQTPRPDVYFEVLRACGALAIVFPEVDALFGVPQPPRWHPEIDTGVHTLMALKLSAELSARTEVRFAVLTHDLGKGTTPKEIWPSHRGHGERSVDLLGRLAERMPVPRRYLDLAVHVAREHGHAHRAHRLGATELYELISTVDGLRQAERFEDFLVACEADARGRGGLEQTPYEQANRLRAAQAAALGVRAAALAERGLEGRALGEALRERRIAAIASALDTDSAAVDQH
jgi:tRNA nucleotidyltransferase (CCA-adding enzyme)